jgi:hypothetical protein
MKIRLAVALLGLAISLALPTIAQQTVDPKIEQQIRALTMKFDEAFNRNDAPAVAALFTEDAFYGTPDGSFHGRQAIEKRYARHSFQDHHANNRSSTVDRVIAVGNEVRATGRWSPVSWTIIWTSSFSVSIAAPLGCEGYCSTDCLSKQSRPHR